jgi:carbon monoxide dehydrogenase subunit G
VASFSHSVDVPLPPAEVFPWLLEADKVPRWTGHLKRYERLDDGPLGHGSKVRQVLDVSGRTIDVTLEITGFQPPSGAQTRFSTNGIDVVNSYALEAVGAGSRLTQSVEAKPSGLAARMLVPVIQPRLEQKLTEDLERLRAELGGR